MLHCLLSLIGFHYYLPKALNYMSLALKPD